MKAIPQHIAVIMDGNGRWAQKRKLPRVAGHHRGVDAARDIVRSCIEKNIPVLTLFAFSSENWQRPPLEVKLLMSLLQKLLTEEVQELHSNGVVLKVIGDTSALSASMQLAIKSAEHLTAQNTRLVLNIAINYGGRWDIVNACKDLCKQVASGDISVEVIDEKLFGSKVSLGNLPSPDLLIRTSGEQRISNFLLWQLAYCEIYFTDTYWPDFGKEEFSRAVEFYSLRNRRFGMVENV